MQPICLEAVATSMQACQPCWRCLTSTPILPRVTILLQARFQASMQSHNAVLLGIGTAAANCWRPCCTQHQRGPKHDASYHCCMPCARVQDNTVCCCVQALTRSCQLCTSTSSLPVMGWCQICSVSQHPSDHGQFEAAATLQCCLLAHLTG